MVQIHFKYKFMYNKRTWLNPLESHATGSVVTFDGWLETELKEYENYRYLEISDCYGKVKIHQVQGSTKQDFIDKLELLANDINLFLVHLKKNK